VFSTYNLTDIEKEVFAEYLQHTMNNPLVELVRYLLGDDYLKFIDIMAGSTFKIPSPKSLEKDLESVKVYLYVKKNGFTEDSIRSAAKLYNRTVLASRKSVYKVGKTLGVEDLIEGDSLNNYILNIKNVEEGISNVPENETTETTETTEIIETIEKQQIDEVELDE